MLFYADDRILYRQIADTRILQNDLEVLKNGRKWTKHRQVYGLICNHQKQLNNN